MVSEVRSNAPGEPAAPPLLAPGDVVERYTVEEAIGQGGMASVYRVRHNSLGSLHALKVLHLLGSGVRARLAQEGRVQASLRHPNVVAVTDVVDVRGDAGLVMEYVDGPTLERWLFEQRPTLEQAESLFRGVLAGVSRAHRDGLVHRDLKPANVLLDRDDAGKMIPKVTDFGLAKILADSDTDHSKGHTKTGITMGTPAYMAPEQVRDAKGVDQRADIFALGCLLYELCTGTSPFERPDMLATFAALSEGTYPPPEQKVPSLPLRIRAAIAGALATAREDRIESCSELLDVLDGKALPRSPTVRRTLDGIPAPRKPVPSALPWLLGALALLGALGAVLGLGATVASWQSIGSTAPPAPSIVDVMPLPPVTAPQPPVPPSQATLPPDPGAGTAAPPPRPVGPAPVAPASPGQNEMAGGTGKEMGTVSVSGNPREMWLEGDDGARHDVGAVPEGVYVLHAVFRDHRISSRRFMVRSGATTYLRCDATFELCKVGERP